MTYADYLGLGLIGGSIFLTGLNVVKWLSLWSELKRYLKVKHQDLWGDADDNPMRWMPLGAESLTHMVFRGEDLGDPLLSRKMRAIRMQLLWVVLYFVGTGGVALMVFACLWQFTWPPHP